MITVVKFQDLKSTQSRVQLSFYIVCETSSIKIQQYKVYSDKNKMSLLSELKLVYKLILLCTIT